METLTAYENPELLSSDAKFVLQYGYSILVLMLITISSSYIIRSVVEEKASRLVEFLMVSVKPLALILGKILAVMTYIFVMFAVTAAGLVCSYIITARFMDVGAVRGLLEQAGLTSLEIGPPDRSDYSGFPWFWDILPFLFWQGFPERPAPIWKRWREPLPR